MLKLFRRLARDLSIEWTDPCSLRQSQAFFIEARRIERAYLRLQSPAYLRRRNGQSSPTRICA